MDEKHIYSAMIQDVIDGNTDPILAYAKIKSTLDFLNRCLDEIKDYAVEEAQKYDKTFELHGFKFERRNGVKRYSFKHLEKWKDLNKKVKDFEQASKQAYLAKQKNLLQITEDGEVMELPEVTQTPDVLIVKKS